MLDSSHSLYIEQSNAPHLYANAKKSCYMKQQSNSFESARKVRARLLADVNFHCKMMSVMALDGVTSFLC